MKKGLFIGVVAALAFNLFVVTAFSYDPSGALIGTDPNDNNDPYLPFVLKDDTGNINSIDKAVNKFEEPKFQTLTVKSKKAAKKVKNVATKVKKKANKKAGIKVAKNIK